jgi:hypothetical protein
MGIPTKFDPCTETAPFYCSWPGGDWLPECAPLSQAEQICCQQREFGPALSPESRQRAVEGGQKAVEDYCLAHPAECTSYQASQDCPALSRLIGPGAAAAYGCSSEPASWALYALLAGAAVFGLIALTR